MLLSKLFLGSKRRQPILSSCRSPFTRVTNIRPASSAHGSQQARYSRKTQVAAALLGFGTTIWAYDHYAKADALLRSFRTLYTGVVILADFKLNFTPEKADKIAALHERVAQRLLWLCLTNQGLYIKLGQALGMQAAVLPKPYQEAFANIFDAAPPCTYSEIEAVFVRDFGKPPQEVFDTFDRDSMAAASIAQVHKATKGDQILAVKIQRPQIEKQIDWDLFCYKALLYTYEKFFDIPCAFIADFVAQQMRLETSFRTEAQNSEKLDKFIQADSKLRQSVYVPKVHWGYTSERVMTADFVQDACRISDPKTFESWGLSRKAVTTTFLDVFSASIFNWGWVHCDPHPGNVLVRRRPANPKKHQLVIIDHGLYISLADSFRQQYCELWRALLVMDTKTVENIARSWGFAAQTDLFASATLLQPFKMRKSSKDSTSGQTGGEDGPQPSQSTFEAQSAFKNRLKSFLENEQLVPRELIFLTRCMRMLQATNQILGSPVNRINLLAESAVSGLAIKTSRSHGSLWKRLAAVLQVVRFKLTLVAIDLVYKASFWYQKWIKGRDAGFEDMLEDQLKEMAQSEFGVELNSDSFMG